jgi:phospholipase C
VLGAPDTGMTSSIRIRATVAIAPIFAFAVLLSSTTLASAAGGGIARSGAPAGDQSPPVGPSPIQHIVILFQENQSFDGVLGKLCWDVATNVIQRPGAHAGCDGVVSGRTSTGTTVPLATPPDIVPQALHAISNQQTAIHGGTMDGFNLIRTCSAAKGYPCYAQSDPLAGPCSSATGSCIPNLAALAETYVISDRTFEYRTAPSWMGHMILASGTTDGFFTNNPVQSTFTDLVGPGSGCESYKDAMWWNGSSFVPEPSCVPDYSLPSAQYPFGGAYRETAVPSVPTIFDRLDGAGDSWKIYGGSGPTKSGYGWTICPTYAECMYGPGRANFVNNTQLVVDAAAGQLPNFSISTPCCGNSQHNGSSMAKGDNYIGRVVSAIQHGPDWASTAIFITYDDCGCFYDHVNPLQYNADWGIRVPMVIVSPYAKLGFTDPTPATALSMLAFTEHDLGLAPLNADDASAYDYAGSFDYNQTPLAPVKMTSTPISAAERRWLAAHPPSESDPT